MNNCMLDTESMGTDPDAALVAIGAVMFDENGGLGATFYRTIHLATSVNAGFKIEPAAVLFWLGQPDEARNAILFNALPMADVMQEFADWLTTQCRRDDVMVWGCSPAFDCIKVEAHCKAVGVRTPWLYFNERCYRTIRERNRVVEADERTGLHNALDDAKHQAQHLIKIRKYHAAKKSRPAD